MIGRLTGQILDKTPPQLLLDVQGVGYELEVPMSTFYELPALGETRYATVHVQLEYRRSYSVQYCTVVRV